MAKHVFKTEVSELLQLITHSLYSHKEIFLRELISNASDAIDKLRYLSVSDDAFKSISFDPRIEVNVDADAKTITISDNGVGMNGEELSENLGTIARSGTRLFLEKLADNDRRNSNLIGQFGVGFYSVFMVADKVEVLSRKAGTDKAFVWTSDGKGEFSVDPSVRQGFGTDVKIHINSDGEEYLSRWSVDNLLKKYSNHIAYPIHLVSMEPDYSKKESKEKKLEDEQVNAASALWRRPKSELSDKDYIDFYKSFTGEEEEPLFWIHTKAEGTIEYNSLLYIPSKVPGDIYYPVSQQGVKLYIKRVFITDREASVLPQYFRFVRGVIDSDDLPLNVSREILQQNRAMTTIKQATLKKLFGELDQLSKTNPEKFGKFVSLFNVQIKEGLASDWENRKLLLGLVRYKSTQAEGWTNLEGCKSRAGDSRKTLYYITGSSEDQLRKSPLIESFVARGIEVLLGFDEIDELVFANLGEYEGMSFKSVNHVDSADEFGANLNAETVAVGEKAAAYAKKVLGPKVKDVRVSKRLDSSPSCIVVDKDDPTMQFRLLMERLGQADIPESKPILELNPSHPLVVKMAAEGESESAEDLAYILLDQALLSEGQKFVETADFIQRVNRRLSKA